MSEQLYRILLRPDAGTKPELWEVKEVRAMHAEEAVRESLTNEQILEWEYEVSETTNTIHSDQFHNDGTFDDIAEEEEY